MFLKFKLLNIVVPRLYTFMQALLVHFTLVSQCTSHPDFTATINPALRILVDLKSFVHG